MIPLRDNVPSSRTPIVNYCLIGACSLVFLVQLGDESDALVWRFGMVPARVRDPQRRIVIQQPVRVRTPFGLLAETRRVVPPPAAVAPWLTLLTCVFLHGGWMHFLGNMWFLYIFGDNVEDRIGHVGYLLFYLGGGAAASFAHLLASPDGTVPTIGASGAIAAVMGAYYVLYPRAKVLTAVPIFYFLEIILLPAPVFLGVWFLIQSLQGTLSITSATSGGGVAWWAHIGGFVFGIAAIIVLRAANLLKPPAVRATPMTTGWRYYRIG